MVNWVAFPGLSILPLGNSLSIDDLVQLGRFRFKIDLTKESEEKVQQEELYQEKKNSIFLRRRKRCRSRGISGARA